MIDKGRLFIGGVYDLSDTEQEQTYYKRLEYLKKNFKEYAWNTTLVRTLNVDDNPYTLDQPKEDTTND